MPVELKDIVYQFLDFVSFINLQQINRSFFIASCRKLAIHTFNIATQQSIEYKILSSGYYCPQRLIIIGGNAWDIIWTLSKRIKMNLKWLELHKAHKNTHQLIQSITETKFQIQIQSEFKTNITCHIAISIKTYEIQVLHLSLPNLYEYYACFAQKFIFNLDVSLIMTNKQFISLIKLINQIFDIVKTVEQKYKVKCQCIVTFLAFDLLKHNKTRYFKSMKLISCKIHSTNCPKYECELSSVQMFF